MNRIIIIKHHSSFIHCLVFTFPWISLWHSDLAKTASLNVWTVNNTACEIPSCYRLQQLLSAQLLGLSHSLMKAIITTRNVMFLDSFGNMWQPQQNLTHNRKSDFLSLSQVLLRLNGKAEQSDLMLGVIIYHIWLSIFSQNWVDSLLPLEVSSFLFSLFLQSKTGQNLKIVLDFSRSALWYWALIIVPFNHKCNNIIIKQYENVYIILRSVKYFVTCYVW